MSYDLDHCIHCKEKFKLKHNVFTEAGVRETRISGFCERCWDDLFADPDEQELLDEHREYHRNQAEQDEYIDELT